MIKKENSKRINYQITSQSVRIVSGNVENKLYSLKEAINLAKDLELDLIEISTTNNISICKITDYSKLQYEEKQKKKEQEKKNKRSEVKEIRLTPTTDTHDFNFKLKHAQNFLEKGDKVKVVVQFAGREINYKEQGEIIILKFAEELTEVGIIECMPQLMGKRMFLQIRPKK
jgi:translation initiation factor IF-3